MLPRYTAEEAKWRSKAKCADFDTDEFFPEKGVNIHHLKEFCSTCPVVAQCLDFAINNIIDYGVWGGTSPQERQNIRTGKRPHPYAAVRR